jgi:PAS domain S-box-containing protein
MESITGRRPLLATVGRGRTRAEIAALLVGLAGLATLMGLDIWLDPGVIAGTFVLAAFVPAVLGRLWSTILIALLAVVAGLVSPAWNGDFGHTAYWIRVSELTVAAGFAVAAAGARSRVRLSSRRLEMLDSVGAIADGSLPLAETLDRVVETIVPIAADLCMIDAIHEGRIVRMAVRARGRVDAAEIEDRLRRQQPWTPSRFVTGERAWMHIAHFRRRMDPEDLRRMAQDADDLAFLQSLRPSSSIVAAMTARGRTLGTLTLVTAWSKRRYSTDDVPFAQVLANRIALALENAGVFSDLESVERRLDAVMSMIHEAVAVHDATGHLVYLNDSAARWLGFASPQEALAAPPEELLGRFDAWSEDGTNLKASLTAERLQRGPLPSREPIRIVLTATGEERWAVVSSEPIRGPDGQLLYAVTTIDDVTELKRSELYQQLLGRTGELLASSIDYREMLDAVARVAVPRFADWCTVNIPDANGLLERVAIAHSDPDRIAHVKRIRERHPIHLDDPGPLPEAIRGGKPLLLGASPASPDDQGSGGEPPPLLRGVELGSAIAAPMTVGARVIGVLVFANEGGSRRFNDDDLALAIEIARRAGLAVENARLAGEQAEVARVLQRGLRPARLPEMPGFEVATMYRPAGELNEVGGDFYEAFEIEPGWMLAMGDVMGRGAQAASLTALARYTIRTVGRLTGDPHLAALMLDQSLKEGTDMSLCTAVILVLPSGDDDPVQVSLLVAGHPLPLLVRAGAVETVGEPGPLLGAPTEPQWRVVTASLSEGDQLVLYTDGVTEARGPDDRFGEARLRAGLAEVADPWQAVARIEAALDSFLVEPPDDDAAMLVIMRSNPPLAPTQRSEAAAAGAPAPTTGGG